MDTRRILESESVEALTDAELADGRQFLLSTLVETTGLPLKALPNHDRLYYFEVRAVLCGSDDFQVCWDGHVSYTDYRDDGQYAYGAHLFLYAGSTRLLPQGFAFRYLLFEEDSTGMACWRDFGWQIDEFDEWMNRELDLGT